MVLHSYSECFWSGELNDTAGYDALVKRNQEGKKLCQELEEYLKKRSKLEFDFSKSLESLTKCFKYREEMGQLESAVNNFRQELESIARSHHGTAVFFSKQAEGVKAFKEDQTTKAKQMEDRLNRAQNTKLTQLTKTIQHEKIYIKRSLERDTALTTLREVGRESMPDKELDKAKHKATKAEEDLQKSDTSYKSSVKMLDDVTTEWEKAMENSCQIVQDMDERRVRYLREEMWMAVNADSKLALDTDNCCEIVRKSLEKCDVPNEIQAFMNHASTGTTRPKHYTFKPYNSRIREAGSDSDSTTSSNGNREDSKSNGINTWQQKYDTKSRNVFTKFQNQLKK